MSQLDITTCNLNDEGNAQIIASLYADSLRYDPKSEQWFIWDGQRWIVDTTNKVFRYVINAAHFRFLESLKIQDKQDRAKQVKWAMQSENNKNVKSALSSAATIQSLQQSKWDEDKMLIGCPNGVIDLRTGSIREGKQDDYITMSIGVPYDKNADCPLWEKFLDDVFEGFQ